MQDLALSRRDDDQNPRSVIYAGVQFLESPKQPGEALLTVWHATPGEGASERFRYDEEQHKYVPFE